MSVSNSDVAAILRFIHNREDTFIRQLTIEDNETPRQPINLFGYSAFFEILSIRKLESIFKITTENNSENINISGVNNNLINLNFQVKTIPAGRYTYVLSVIDPSKNVKTWLKGDFIIT